ncbi:hypothetical protein MSAN_01615300 [Mycena sanguinolenta]|uniref:Uncharacterized protein n=1 Tax=Mycena sanguinolenta TaxID=230812 RepID=A0A8H6Y215_9AGAR|nr:hypothetical protein MSAN_01615300 [Mycena sanguinolenta]
MSIRPLESLERIDLPGRDPILPELYWSTGHPRMPLGEKCIVLVYDTSDAAMARLLAWEKAQKVPHNKTDDELLAMGRLRVPPDVMFFCRSKGCPDASQDAEAAWLYPASSMPEADKEALRKVAEAVIGPRESVSLQAPMHKDDGTWVGGLAFERSDACKPVKHNTRCYTIANSYQTARGTWAPASSSKVCGSFDENNQMRHDLNLAIAPFPMHAMKKLPSETYDTIYQHTNMLNIPSLGLLGNTAHNTVQMNVASAVPYGSKETLNHSLGPFGDLHNDQYDSPGRFTNMTMYSTLPDNYILSQFHIPRFGIYFVLCNFDSANFCGLNYHGGTPAIAPEGFAVKNDAYRLTFISYPQESMGDGLGHVVVGALPSANDTTLKMSSEMQNVDCEAELPVSSNRANFAADGRVVMDIRAHVTFMARMLLLLVVFLSNQLPSFYDIRIDSDRLLTSISFATANNKRETVSPWPNAPGYRQPDPSAFSEVDDNSDAADNSGTLVSQLSLRTTVKRRYRLHYNRLAFHIPFARLSDKIPELDDSGALVHPGALVSQAVDPFTGNPIDFNGRAYRKPIRPMSKNKAEKLAKIKAAAKNKAENDTSCSGKGKRKQVHDDNSDGDRDSEAVGKLEKRRRKQNTQSNTSNEDRGESSEGCHHKSLHPHGQNLHVEDGQLDPDRHTDADNTDELSGESNPLWSSEACMNMEGILTTIPEGQCNSADVTLPFSHSGSLEVQNFVQGIAEIKLVDCLQYNSILEDYTTVESAYRSIQSEEPVPVEHSTLVNILEGIQNAPSAVKTCVQIAHVWDHFAHLRSSAASATLYLKWQHHGVMIATFYLWYWLDSYCVRIITLALCKPASCWIGHLTKHVSMLLSTRVDSCLLQAAEFGLESLDSVYHFHYRSLLDLDVPPDQVVAVVLDIIACWLNYPTKSKSRAQAWFVDALVYSCHHATLFLDSVWYAFNHLETQIFGNKNVNITSPAAFDLLRTRLVNCSLTDSSSAESQLLSSMQKMLNEYRAGTITPVSSAAPPRLFLSASDSSQVRLMNKFLAALLELELLIDPSVSLSSPSLFQNAVSLNMDFLLPFREHGPSRVRSRLPGNSFDPAHSRTLGGLFSGLIFRGIIFATPFSMQAHTYFANPDAWHLEIARFPEHNRDFFCNLAAYSCAKSNRGVHLVNEYWATLTDPTCPDWVANTRDGSYDFTACYEFLKASHPVRFREIGSLIGFLLTADFHYAGAVKAPNVLTVATIIRDINKGGMKGLEQLELITRRPVGAKNRPRKGDVEQVRNGFHTLHRFLDTHLSVESKRRMHFDAIMVENSLCKWTRWVKKGLVTF